MYSMAAPSDTRLGANHLIQVVHHVVISRSFGLHKTSSVDAHMHMMMRSLTRMEGVMYSLVVQSVHADLWCTDLCYLETVSFRMYHSL